MCNIVHFFSLLSFYFVVLTFFTILRKEITYRGIFFLLNFLLMIFILYLLFLFNPVILLNSHSEFFWNFNTLNWLTVDVSLSLRLDGLSYLFVLLVVIIGFGTNFYILNYLKYEAHEDLFTLLINWFMFSMVLLVLSNNLFTLFLGWESIGLSSFFLINFWNTRRGTVKSSFKAFFFNKISDVFLFIFLVGIHYVSYTNNLILLNLKTALNFLPTTLSISTISTFLFMCTLFKSAQIFGHLWLPDSMEAPVPASALIHSATLVSAGVYLLLRFTPLITLNNLHLSAIIIGSITAAYGGIISASQTDMKKLLAYSTISHCGFLFVTIGTEVYLTVIIYLFLHGLFKALTFFCAGSFIRVSGSQDTRQMGALSRVLPVDTIFLIICAFNLAGLPFSIGYLYKSVLIASLLNTNVTFVVLGFCTVGLLTSIIYAYRLVYYSAFDTAKEFFLSVVYELQQKQNNVSDYYSLTTFIQIIAILILLLFTGWIYIYFINYFINANITLDHMPILLDANFYLTLHANKFFKSYYEIFYIFYVLLAYILFLITWRYEYTYNFKVNLITTLSGSSIFFVIYTSILTKMWGHVLTEASTQQNFNFGFSTYKSEILVHLSQWQYWWWFWFSLWWALYYFIILRTMTKRTFNFNITMNTSVRGRGKWGDFLVALIPITWCCNILINSNFILRMIEWQNESSLFTIRIQGKQWYWVYKYDPNTAQAVISTPKNIGHNRWRVVSGQESYNADTYYQAIHLAAHLEFQDSYSKFTEKVELHKKNLNNMSLSSDKLLLASQWYPLRTNLTPKVESLYKPLDSDQSKIDNTLSFASDIEFLQIAKTPSTWFLKAQLFESSPRTYKVDLVDTQLTMYKVYYNQNLNTLSTLFTEFSTPAKANYNAFYDYLQLDETADADSNNRHYISTQPFRLMRGVLNKHVADILQNEKFKDSKLTKPIFLNTKFSQGGELLKEKELMPETLWGFRQKKYKRLKKFKFKPEVIYDPVTFEVIGQKKINLSPNIDIAGVELYNTNAITNNKISSADIRLKNKDRPLEENFNYRIASRINRHRSELVPVTLARRLLRTKRTLVLPAHVNITVITNSYDVVHSWFVPGLGLKMDCVPGRSTHHTFYIDNIGFYYGQCAEICGRYHHHMPIRLCALPFEHFVVWWQSKGLARMNRTSEIRRNRFLDHDLRSPVTKEKLIYRNN